MRLQKVHLNRIFVTIRKHWWSFHLIDEIEKCHKPNLAKNDSTKWIMHKEGPQRYTVSLGKVRPVRFEWCLGIRLFRRIALFSFWALSILTYQIVFNFFSETTETFSPSIPRLWRVFCSRILSSQPKSDDRNCWSSRHISHCSASIQTSRYERLLNSSRMTNFIEKSYLYFSQKLI